MEFGGHCGSGDFKGGVDTNPWRKAPIGLERWGWFPLKSQTKPILMNNPKVRLGSIEAARSLRRLV